MPRRYTLLSLLAMSILVLAGCTGPARTVVNLEQEFTLSPGQSVSIASENIYIKFVEVISDSRCPQGVTCIWAGEVSCVVETTVPDNATPPVQRVLTQTGSSDQPAKQTLNRYEVAFKVTPYPAAGRAISPEEYRLVMIVTKPAGP